MKKKRIEATPEQKLQILEHYKAGNGISSIAQKIMKLPQGTVQRTIEASGLMRPKKLGHAMAHKKLAREKVRTELIESEKSRRVTREKL